jgi:hypothetical protein
MVAVRVGGYMRGVMRVELEAVAKVQTWFRGLAPGGESGGGGRPMGVGGNYCRAIRCRARLNFKKIQSGYIC